MVRFFGEDLKKNSFQAFFSDFPFFKFNLKKMKMSIECQARREGKGEEEVRGTRSVLKF